MMAGKFRRIWRRVFVCPPSVKLEKYAKIRDKIKHPGSNRFWVKMVNGQFPLERAVPARTDGFLCVSIGRPCRDESQISL